MAISSASRAVSRCTSACSSTHARAAAPAAARSWGEQRQHLGERRAQRRGIAGRHQPPPRLAHALRQADRVGGDDHQLHRHRLLDDDRHRVAVAVARDDARHRQDVGALELGAHPVGLQGAEQLDAVQLVAQRPVPHDPHARVEPLAARARSSKPFFATSRPTPTTVRPPGSGGPAPEALAVDAHHEHLDARVRRDRAQVARVVLAAGGGERRALELGAQVARRQPDVPRVRGDAVARAGQRRDAQRVERRAGGEVHVDVLAGAQPPHDGRELAQRAHPLLAAQPPRAGRGPRRQRSGWRATSHATSPRLAAVLGGDGRIAVAALQRLDAHVVTRGCSARISLTTNVSVSTGKRSSRTSTAPGAP